MWPRSRHVSPSCHLGGIEAPAGGPQCRGMLLLAAAFAVQLSVTVRVYDNYGLPAETRQEALALAAEALERAGIQAVIVDCNSRPAASACAAGLGEGELVLRIHRHPKDGIHVLGDAIVRASGPSTESRRSTPRPSRSAPAAPAVASPPSSAASRRTSSATSCSARARTPSTG